MYPKEDGELEGNYLFSANSLFLFLFFCFFTSLLITFLC